MWHAKGVKAEAAIYHFHCIALIKGGHKPAKLKGAEIATTS